MNNDIWKSQLRKQISSFFDISEIEWNKFLNLLKPLMLKKDDFFYYPGRTTNLIGYIIKGLVRTYSISNKGVEINTDFCREEDIIGSIDFYTDETMSNQFLQSLEDTYLMTITQKEYKEMIEDSLEWHKLHNKYVEYLYSFKAKREKDLISMDAEERYKELLNDFENIEKRIPQYHIASYLGITPIQLSRIRKKMGLT